MSARVLRPLPQAHVVITGGAGFLGSHLCERFLAEGARVTAVDNLLTGSRDNIAHLLDDPRFVFVEHDITRHLDIEGDVDVILHFATATNGEMAYRSCRSRRSKSVRSGRTTCSAWRSRRAHGS